MGMSISLNTAASALLAQQLGVDTTSHNISNATTTGYSRQRMRLQSMPGLSDGVPRPGLGVEAVSIDRVRDLFTDYQIRGQLTSTEQYNAQTQALTRIETILAEPGDAGLRAALDRFFNSWRDLSNSPESGPARIAVLEAGKTLGQTASSLSATLVQSRTEADERLRADVTEINSLTSEIADLNDKVARLQLAGGGSADLRDRRDIALDRLSQLLNVSYFETQEGRIEISTGGHPLVAGTTAFALETVTDPLNSNYVNIRFAGDGVALNPRGGEMRALLDMRDTYVPARLAELDTLAAQIISDVNAAHFAGYGLDGVTGRNFFVGTGASSMAVAPAVLVDTNTVAASRTLGGVPGDGGNALAISDKQYARVLGGGTQTYNDFFGAFASGIGVALREARSRGEAQDLVLEQLRSQRDSVSGVSVDEEMVSLIQYQRAYEAASRLVRVADEMLDTLINRM